MTKVVKLDAETLRRFTSSENYYRHALNHHVLFTEGAKFLADAGAHWLLDIIACAQLYAEKIRPQPFQVWTVLVRPDRSATITVEDGNNHCLWTFKIASIDFPLEAITLWFAHGLISLPSER